MEYMGRRETHLEMEKRHNREVIIRLYEEIAK